MSFDRLRHQDEAVATLRTLVAGDRLPHALLFVGPRGVGKGLAARELAKVLFCTGRGAGAAGDRGGDAPDACDACDACRRVDRGVHPDLYWFAKEPDRNEFRIGLVTRRDESPETVVLEAVALAPMEAERTVTVLDDAELLNTAAANALLKTLEEPASRAVLVLLCADASRLPGTVRSRCRPVRFAPLPDAFVAERVAAMLEAEGQEGRGGAAGGEAAEVSAEEIAYVARFAGGSIERARTLAGSGLWALKRDVVAALPRLDEASAFGAAEAIDAWARRQAKARRQTSESREETALRRDAVRTALAAAAAAFRDALVAAHGAAAPEETVNADQPEALAALARWPADALGRAIEHLVEAQGRIDRYVHVELATENALLQIARLRLVTEAA